MMHTTKTEDRSWIRILLLQFPLIKISADFNTALSIEINGHVMKENRPRRRIPHPFVAFLHVS